MSRVRSVNDDALVAVMRQAGKPLSAYELIERLPDKPKPKAPVIYRALERLCADSKVHRIESLKAFVSCDGHHHDHETVFAVCRDCKQVQEIEDHQLCGLLADWKKKTGFMPSQKTFEILGQCAECRPS